MTLIVETGPAGWLTSERRKALYALGAALASVLVGVGWITETQTGHVLTLVGVAVQVAAGVLQLRHLSAAQAAKWLTTTGRAALYSLAAATALAAAGLGLVSDSVAAQIAAVAGLGLSVLAAFVAVLNADGAE
ncbi:MAG: hypothetical protein LBG60_14980 [Bifidobacteriaceae bacterium]|jgi:hypothetical protein|nr:hypothetical protein [Bifidobacteriaceae bacterium]